MKRIVTTLMIVLTLTALSITTTADSAKSDNCCLREQFFTSSQSRGSYTCGHGKTVTTSKSGTRYSITSKTEVGAHTGSSVSAGVEGTYIGSNGQIYTFYRDSIDQSTKASANFDITGNGMILEAYSLHSWCR